MTFRALLTAVLGAAALASSAHATTLIDTGTPDGRSPWTLSPQQWLGGQFTLDQAATITEILGFIDGRGDGDLTIAIHQDEGSGVPGAELFSRAFTADGNVDFQGLSGLSWRLAAGSYYVTAEVRSGQTFSGAMPGFSPHPLGHEVFTQGGQWLGADGLELGWRISDDAVPEPEVWALMIGGLGAAGAMLRRRRQLTLPV